MRTYPEPAGNYEIEHHPSGRTYEVNIYQSMDDLTRGMIVIRDTLTRVVIFSDHIETPWDVGMDLPDITPEGSEGVPEPRRHNLSNYGEKWLSLALRAVQDHYEVTDGLHISLNELLSRNEEQPPRK